MARPLGSQALLAAAALCLCLSLVAGAALRRFPASWCAMGQELAVCQRQ
jgi:hypothetical protein